MGWNAKELPESFRRLMTPEARAACGLPDPDPKQDVHPPAKRDVAERKEQGSFANWVLLQQSKGRRIPFVWHATHRPSKATPGTPDFWVGVNGAGVWIEFKRDYSCELTPEQAQFSLDCDAQGIPFFVVYSAWQAITIVEDFARPLGEQFQLDIIKVRDAEKAVAYLVKS